MTEKCIICGKEIPEGRQVCTGCERKAYADMEADLKAAHEEIGRLKARLEKAIVLPCMVGEKGFIYGSYEEIDGSTQYWVQEVTLEGFLDERHRGGKLWYLALDNGDSTDVPPEVFCLTKEQAEARLKELTEGKQW